MTYPPLQETVKVRTKVLDALKSVPHDNILTAIALQDGLGETPELGEEIALPDGTKVRLIRANFLENKILFADPQLFVRQPRQPRGYFNPDRMQELAATISTHGQCDPVHVVPVLFPDKSVRLMIIDGERRFRVVLNLALSYVKFTTDWVENEDELHERSFMLNAKEEHTIFEISNEYARMVEARKKRKSMNRGQAIADIARSIGKGRSHIEQYLGFQAIDPAAREIFGNKMGQGSAEALVRALRKAKGDVDQVAVAQRIVENPFAQRGTLAGKVTVATVRTITRDQLAASGTITREEKLEMKARDGLALLNSAVYQGLQAVDFLEGHGDLVPAMIRQLRLRKAGKPAEVVHENIRELVDGFRAWYENVIKPAMNFPPLKIPDNAPRFSDHLENRKKQLGGHGLREKIARILAYTSDSKDQTPVTAQDIVRILKDRNVSTDSTTVASNLLQMEEPLGNMGFELDIHVVRRRSQEGKAHTIRGRSDLVDINAYRLRWNKEMLKQFC